MSRRQEHLPAEVHEIAPSGEAESETIVGRELAALIRDESQAAPVASLVLPPRPVERQPTGGLENKRKITVRRIADAVGILIALAIIFAAYRWFSDLPKQPADSPWALLGSGRSDAGVDHATNGKKGTTPTASQDLTVEADPPLGQFDFGPDDLPVSFTDEKPSPRENVERYRSIQELEAAFDAKYVSPPECYQWGSSAQMASCGNHRIRARRAFIESGGRLAPAMFGAAAPLPPQTEPYRLEMRGEDAQGTWRQDWRGDPGRQSWEDSSRGWAEEQQSEAGRDWRQPWTDEVQKQPEQDWRKSWLQESPQDREGDWRRQGLRDPRQGGLQDWPQQ